MENRLDGGTRLPVALVLGGILGLVQLGLFFTDLPPSVTLASRVVAGAVLGAASGVVLGRLQPGNWVWLSLLATWGAMVWGAVLGAMKTAGWPAVLIVPAAVAILAGYAGAIWRRRLEK